MLTCTGCGASYNDTCKFCPYCGRAKREPESMNLNVHVVPTQYVE